MRDYFSHTELLLAGMWGGNAFIYPARVKGGEWLMSMPFFLTDPWKAGELRVKAL